MALRDRIHSLETEYAITFYGDGDEEHRPGPGTIVDVLMDAVSDSHGTFSSAFLVNGSRLAHDVGHAEWSLPECRSAREAAVYDRAADHLLLHTLVPVAEKTLIKDGFEGRLVVSKNNADSFGNTYGCHENYQMQRNAELLMEGDFLRYLAHSLIPFLVSRQILTGAGRVITERVLSAQRVRYELSQRSSFIQTVVSRDTTRSRPIFNLGREGEAFAAGNARRLHLILGDANLSGWATWIKMGSTGLMLRLIEDLFIDDVPALSDPVGALKTISRDWSGQTTVRLQDGSQASALDIQWRYYDLVDAYLNVFGASTEDEDLMEAWGQALEDFGRDPMLLRDRADWAIKKQLLDSFMQQRGYSLDEPPTDRQILTDLQAFDLRYHELSAEGLYHRVYPVDTLLTQQEIEEAEENPPPYTRARIRGEAIRLSREYGLHVRTERWTDVSIEETPLNLSDPLEFDHPGLAHWDRPWCRLEKEIEQNPDNHALYYKLGRCYQSLGLYQRAAKALQTAMERAPEDSNYIHELARNFSLMGRYDDAVLWFEKYNQLADHNRDRDSHDYSSLAYAYRHLGEYQKALQLYRKAAQSDSSSRPLAYRGIGMVHLMRGETGSAATYFQKSLQITSERLLSSVGLGVMLWSRGELDRARSLFGEALALPRHRATFGLTDSTTRYIQAVAQIGLEKETCLATLTEALQTQTAEAADGIFLAKTLLRLLAQASIAPRDAGAGSALVEPVQVILDPPDTAELPLMPERHHRWLEKALNHSSAEIRARAVLSLGWRINDEQAPNHDDLLRQLVDKAQQDTDPEVRQAAVQALGRIKTAGTDVSEVLIQCLQDRSSIVRWEAQSALEQIHRPDATPAGMVEVSSTISGSRLGVHRDTVAELPADELPDVPDWLDVQF